MNNINWLKDCELCNNGVCKRIDDLKESGLSERAAAKQMEQDCDGLRDASKIRDRYRYYKKGHSGGNPPKHPTLDLNMSLVQAAEVFGIGLKPPGDNWWVSRKTLDCMFNGMMRKYPESGDLFFACKRKLQTVVR